jgi:hypothetical protein
METPHTGHLAPSLLTSSGHLASTIGYFDNQALLLTKTTKGLSLASILFVVLFATSEVHKHVI